MAKFYLLPGSINALLVNASIHDYMEVIGRVEPGIETGSDSEDKVE